MLTATSPEHERLARILDRIRVDVPTLVLVDKHTLWWMRALGVLLRPFLTDFMTRYTTVLGRTVYLPCPPAAFPPRPLAATLAHELVHMLDMQTHGWWFYVSYGVWPFPILRTGRAHWERRGYAVDLMLAYEEGGEAALWSLNDWLVGIFSGPSYLFMWAGEAAARAYLEPTLDAVRTGALQAEEPYRSILEAWRGDRPVDQTTRSPLDRSS